MYIWLCCGSLFFLEATVSIDILGNSISVECKYMLIAQNTVTEILWYRSLIPKYNTHKSSAKGSIVYF